MLTAQSKFYLIYIVYSSGCSHMCINLLLMMIKMKKILKNEEKFLFAKDKPWI